MTLNPCPFCRTEALHVTEARRDSVYFYVFCNVCQACGPTEPTAETAVVAWNRNTAKEVKIITSATLGDLLAQQIDIMTAQSAHLEAISASLERIATDYTRSQT